MRLEKAKSQCTTPLRPPDQMAVYFAFLELGDTVLGMDLACGGHLTHGSPVSFSGKFYSFVHCGVKAEPGTIDYDEVAELVRKHRPKMILAGASAYPRIIDFNTFANIARDVGAFFWSTWLTLPPWWLPKPTHRR